MPTTFCLQKSKFVVAKMTSPQAKNMLPVILHYLRKRADSNARRKKIIRVIAAAKSRRNKLFKLLLLLAQEIENEVVLDWVEKYVPLVSKTRHHGSFAAWLLLSYNRLNPS